MSDSTTPEDDRVLAAEYALGLMTSDEARAFGARVAREPALAGLVGAWQEDFAGLTDNIDPVTPPRRTWRGIDRRLFGETRSPFWMIPAVPGLLAAGFAVALILSPDILPPRAPADPVYHADLAGEDGTIILAAGYDGVRGVLYVIPHLAPDEGRDHELWLIAGNNAPVSLGLLPENRPARLDMTPELAEQLEDGTLAISVEPDGGSTTGAPTGPVIATGAVMTL